MDENQKQLKRLYRSAFRQEERFVERYRSLYEISPSEWTTTSGRVRERAFQVGRRFVQSGLGDLDPSILRGDPSELVDRYRDVVPQRRNNFGRYEIQEQQRSQSRIQSTLPEIDETLGGALKDLLQNTTNIPSALGEFLADQVHGAISTEFEERLASARIISPSEKSVTLPEALSPTIKVGRLMRILNPEKAATVQSNLEQLYTKQIRYNPILDEESSVVWPYRGVPFQKKNKPVQVPEYMLDSDVGNPLAKSIIGSALNKPLGDLGERLANAIELNMGANYQGTAQIIRSAKTIGDLQDILVRSHIPAYLNAGKVVEQQTASLVPANVMDIAQEYAVGGLEALQDLNSEHANVSAITHMLTRGFSRQKAEKDRQGDLSSIRQSLVNLPTDLTGSQDMATNPFGQADVAMEMQYRADENAQWQKDKLDRLNKIKSRIPTEGLPLAGVWSKTDALDLNDFGLSYYKVSEITEEDVARQTKQRERYKRGERVYLSQRDRVLMEDARQKKLAEIQDAQSKGENFTMHRRLLDFLNQEVNGKPTVAALLTAPLTKGNKVRAVVAPEGYPNQVRIFPEDIDRMSEQFGPDLGAKGDNANIKALAQAIFMAGGEERAIGGLDESGIASAEMEAAMVDIEAPSGQSAALAAVRQWEALTNGENTIQTASQVYLSAMKRYGRDNTRQYGGEEATAANSKIERYGGIIARANEYVRGYKAGELPVLGPGISETDRRLEQTTRYTRAYSQYIDENIDYISPQRVPQMYFGPIKWEKKDDKWKPSVELEGFKLRQILSSNRSGPQFAVVSPTDRERDSLQNYTKEEIDIANKVVDFIGNPRAGYGYNDDLRLQVLGEHSYTDISSYTQDQINEAWKLKRYTERHTGDEMPLFEAFRELNKEGETFTDQGEQLQYERNRAEELNNIQADSFVGLFGENMQTYGPKSKKYSLASMARQTNSGKDFFNMIATIRTVVPGWRPESWKDEPSTFNADLPGIRARNASSQQTQIANQLGLGSASDLREFATDMANFGTLRYMRQEAEQQHQLQPKIIGNYWRNLYYHIKEGKYQRGDQLPVPAWNDEKGKWDFSGREDWFAEERFQGKEIEEILANEGMKRAERLADYAKTHEQVGTIWTGASIRAEAPDLYEDPMYEDPLAGAPPMPEEFGGGGGGRPPEPPNFDPAMEEPPDPNGEHRYRLFRSRVSPDKAPGYWRTVNAIRNRESFVYSAQTGMGKTDLIITAMEQHKGIGINLVPSNVLAKTQTARFTQDSGLIDSSHHLVGHPGEFDPNSSMDRATYNKNLQDYQEQHEAFYRSIGGYTNREFKELYGSGQGLDYFRAGGWTFVPEDMQEHVAATMSFEKFANLPGLRLGRILEEYAKRGLVSYGIIDEAHRTLEATRYSGRYLMEAAQRVLPGVPFGMLSATVSEREAVKFGEYLGTSNVFRDKKKWGPEQDPPLDQKLEVYSKSGSRDTVGEQVLKLLQENNSPATLVFAQSVDEVIGITEFLKKNQIDAANLHKDPNKPLTEEELEEAMHRLGEPRKGENGEMVPGGLRAGQVLVATLGSAGAGIHNTGASMVINAARSGMHVQEQALGRLDIAGKQVILADPADYHKGAKKIRDAVGMMDTVLPELFDHLKTLDLSENWQVASGQMQKAAQGWLEEKGKNWGKVDNLRPYPQYATTYLSAMQEAGMIELGPEPMADEQGNFYNPLRWHFNGSGGDVFNAQFKSLNDPKEFVSYNTHKDELLQQAREYDLIGNFYGRLEGLPAEFGGKEYRQLFEHVYKWRAEAPDVFSRLRSGAPGAERMSLLTEGGRSISLQGWSGPNFFEAYPGDVAKKVALESLAGRNAIGTKHTQPDGNPHESKVDKELPGVTVVETESQQFSGRSLKAHGPTPGEPKGVNDRLEDFTTNVQPGNRFFNFFEELEKVMNDLTKSGKSAAEQMRDFSEAIKPAYEKLRGDAATPGDFAQVRGQVAQGLASRGFGAGLAGEFTRQAMYFKAQDDVGQFSYDIAMGDREGQGRGRGKEQSPSFSKVQRAFMYGAYMDLRWWGYTIGAQAQEATKAAGYDYMAPAMFGGGQSYATSQSAYGTRLLQGQEALARGAMQQYGAFTELPYYLSGSDSYARGMAGVKTGLGISMLGLQTGGSLGMMGLPGAASLGLTGSSIGLGVAFGSVGAEVVNSTLNLKGRNALTWDNALRNTMWMMDARHNGLGNFFEIKDPERLAQHYRDLKVENPEKYNFLTYTGETDREKEARRLATTVANEIPGTASPAQYVDLIAGISKNLPGGMYGNQRPITEFFRNASALGYQPAQFANQFEQLGGQFGYVPGTQQWVGLMNQMGSNTFTPQDLYRLQERGSRVAMFAGQLAPFTGGYSSAAQIAAQIGTPIQAQQLARSYQDAQYLGLDLEKEVGTRMTRVDHTGTYDARTVKAVHPEYSLNPFKNMGKTDMVPVYETKPTTFQYSTIEERPTTFKEELAAAQLGYSPYINNLTTQALGPMAQLGMNESQYLALTGSMNKYFTSQGFTPYQAGLAGQILGGDLKAWSFASYNQPQVLGALNMSIPGSRVFDQSGNPIYETSGKDFMAFATAQYRMGNPGAAGAAGLSNLATVNARIYGGNSMQAAIQTAQETYGLSSSDAAIYAQSGIRGLSYDYRARINQMNIQSAGINAAQIAEQQQYLWGGGQWTGTPAPGSLWALQDQQRLLQNKATLRGFQYSLNRMDIGNEFAVQQEQLSLERMNTTQAQQRWQFGYQAQGMQLSQKWAREDWQYQDTTRGLQFGWNMEDLNEDIRFATGRQRRRLIKQKDRLVESHNLEEGQIDTQRDRQETMWQREQEQFNKQKQYAETLMGLDKQQFELSKNQRETFYQMERENLLKTREEYKKQYELEKEIIKLNRDHEAKQLAFQAAQNGLAAEAAKLQAKLEEIQRKNADVWGDTAGYLKNIADYNPSELVKPLVELLITIGAVDPSVVASLRTLINNIQHLDPTNVNNHMNGYMVP